MTFPDHSSEAVRVGSAAAEVEEMARRSLWHHSDFRRLWIGETARQFGTTIST